jgi:hypothetical protein
VGRSSPALSLSRMNRQIDLESKECQVINWNGRHHPALVDRRSISWLSSEAVVFIFLARDRPDQFRSAERNSQH